MSFDGFLYVFAFVGIITTAVAASLGIALTLTMARFTYMRFKRVAPLLFFTADGQPPKTVQRGGTLEELGSEAPSKYTEKTRMPVSSVGH